MFWILRKSTDISYQVKSNIKVNKAPGTIKRFVVTVSFIVQFFHFFDNFLKRYRTFWKPFKISKFYITTQTRPSLDVGVTNSERFSLKVQLYCTCMFPAFPKIENTELQFNKLPSVLSVYEGWHLWWTFLIWSIEDSKEERSASQFYSSVGTRTLVGPDFAPFYPSVFSLQDMDDSIQQYARTWFRNLDSMARSHTQLPSRPVRYTVRWPNFMLTSIDMWFPHQLCQTAPATSS